MENKHLDPATYINWKGNVIGEIHTTTGYEGPEG